MRTKSLPFQLEQTTPSAFLLQGLAGGMLVGFVLVLVLILVKPNPYNFLLIFYTPAVMAVCGVLGMIKAVPLWAMYRLMGIRLRAPVRIVVSTVGFTSIVLFLYYAVGPISPSRLVPTVIWSVLFSLPIAVLVGSRVRPEEIFTYWRVTFREHGIKEILSSSGILAMGGVLPLRLLSIAGLGLWMLGSAVFWSLGETDVSQEIMFMLLPITCFAVSAYLTFNSPGKFVLLVIGLVINLLLTYTIYFVHTTFPKTFTEISTVLTIVDTIFLSAWVAFVATRFIVNTNDFLRPAHASSIFEIAVERNHHCLGSRFLKWREGEAL